MPQVTSCCPGPVGIHQLRILPGRAGRPDDCLGPGLELADDLDAPMAEIGRNLIGDIGPLDAAALPAAAVWVRVDISGCQFIVGAPYALG